MQNQLVCLLISAIQIGLQRDRCTRILSKEIKEVTRKKVNENMTSYRVISSYFIKA